MKLVFKILVLIAVIFPLAIFACPTLTMSSTNVSCFMGSDGSATVTITGDNGPFNVTWSTSQTNPNISSGGSATANSLPAGIYNVYVVDQLGCTSVNLVVIEEPSLVSGVTAISDNLCFGGTNGSINLSPFGGTAPYTYSWSNLQTTEDLQNLNSGSYSVTITDANGCLSNSITSVIQEPSSAVESTIVGKDISCFNGSDGEIELNPFGGTPPYTFNWNSGTYLTKDINNLTAGNYTTVITDANGCTNSNSLTLVAPPQISPTIQKIDVDCFGNNSGSINLSVTGGTQPYSFAWSNATTIIGNNEDLFNLTADDYTVDITDDNGCMFQTNSTIVEPNLIETSIVKNDVSCFGLSDGNINLSVIGGIPPYSYSWSNSSMQISSSEDLLNIPAETYSLSLNDVNGCLATEEVIITQPLLPISITNISKDVLCNGENTGEIDITITGGTLPYTISWSNSQTTEDVTDLFAGNYTVTIVDNNNCIENSSINIIEPTLPLSNIFNIINVSCFGDTNGTINSLITGGTTPYQYSWKNSNFSLSTITPSLINFPADDYYLEIIDANGCLFFDTASILQPQELTTNLEGTNILCHGESTGSINVTVNGGTSPYNFLWSNSSISQNIQNLTADTYYIQITDANLCQHSDSITLTEPLEALNSYHFITEPECYGGSNGGIDYFLSGGTPPYNYNWSTGDITPNIVNIISGSYTITATDSNNCQLIESIIVTQPQQIDFSPIIDSVTCHNDQNGAIFLNISGGTPNYSVQWSNSTYVLSQTTENITNLDGGVYTAIVTDVFGCENSSTFEVYEPELLEGYLDIKQISCIGKDDGELNAIVQGGNDGGYTYTWDNGESTALIQNLPPNSYNLLVSDLKGCKIELSAEIVNPDPIVFEALINEVSCRDQKDGSILVEASGGAGNFSYEWSNNETGDFIENLLGGDYTVIATDALDCQSDTTIFVPTNDVVCITPPTVFTPQGDGVNDTWVLVNIELYPEAVISILDSWGKTVFESNGYPNPWNGDFNGKKLPYGTYYYIIKLKEDGAVFTGPVTILR